MEMTRTEPFLKWAGGKRGLLDKILPHFPVLHPNGTYYEPFLGGGAVFFGLRPSRGILADSNQELIETFVAVRDEVGEIISHLKDLPYDSKVYYEVRASIPTTKAERAARFIYLNKTCYNGLYRVNLKGEFNVPFGNHPSSIEICNEQQLRDASMTLKGATLFNADFEETAASATAGDLVYFDPPYTTAHTNNGFIEYNAKVFSWSDQRRLAQVAAELVDRGVQVAISNGDHSSVLECYLDTRRFKAIRIQRWSTIASRAKKRMQTSELLLIGSPLGETKL